MAVCSATQSPTFQPAMRIITNITQDYIAEVTTSFSHNYSTGLIVRLIVPVTFGMTQANNFKGEITVTSDVTFTIPLNTINFDAFITPAGTTSEQDKFCAQVIPVGEVNSSIAQAKRNVL